MWKSFDEKKFLSAWAARAAREDNVLGAAALEGLMNFQGGDAGAARSNERRPDLVGWWVKFPGDSYLVFVRRRGSEVLPGSGQIGGWLYQDYEWAALVVLSPQGHVIISARGRAKWFDESTGEVGKSGYAPLPEEAAKVAKEIIGRRGEFALP